MTSTTQTLSPSGTSTQTVINANISNTSTTTNNGGQLSILSAVIEEHQQTQKLFPQQPQHHLHNHYDHQHHLHQNLNTISNGNSNSNQEPQKSHNNCNNSNKNNSNNINFNSNSNNSGITLTSQQPLQTLTTNSSTLLAFSNSNSISDGNNYNMSTTTTTTSSNKSETSSIGSISGGSVKKISSSTSTLMNNSREDIRSIGGTSSINSNIITHNHHDKERKDINSQYFNDLPPAVGSNYISGGIADEDDGLGPLPPKWEKAYTEGGELYFIDHNTGTSHWLDPRLSKFQKKSLEDCSDDELPYGWEKIDDPQYGTYFIDHVNRRTQYENPVLEAKRRAERNRSSNKNCSVSPNEHNLNHRNIRRSKSPISRSPYTFTKNPNELQGERLTTTLLKSSRGLGITIVGGDDNVEEFLQIKSIVPNGPAWLDGKLQTGDVLVYVNDTCVLGFTHHEMVNVFQSILPGETVTLEICRGYPLPFDPNDPNTEVVTTIAVDGINSEPEKSRMLMDLNIDRNYNFLELSDSAGAVGGGPVPSIPIQKSNPLSKIVSADNNDADRISRDFAENFEGEDMDVTSKSEIIDIPISKGVMGFGFTITDSIYGQKVKKILDRDCCKNLQEGDILLEINSIVVKHMSHSEVVRVLKDCPKTAETIVKVQRGHFSNNINSTNRFFNGTLNLPQKLRKSNITKENIASGLYRSKTPTADLYSTQPKEILPIRPKTPLVDTRRARVKTPSNELNEEVEAVTSGLLTEKNLNSNLRGDDMNKSIPLDAKSNNSLHEIDSINNDIPFMDPYPKLVTNLTERLAEASLGNDNSNLYHPNSINHHHLSQQTPHIQHNPYHLVNNNSNFDGQSINHEYNLYGTGMYPKSMGSDGNDLYSPPPPMPIMAPVPTYHHETCYCYNCQDYNRYLLEYQNQGLPQVNDYALGLNGRYHQKRLNDYIIDQRKSGLNSLENNLSNPLLQSQQLAPQSLGNQYSLHNFGMYKYEPETANNLIMPMAEDEFILSEVTLERQASGFGFRIVGGTEEGSQVTVGHIVPGGSAYGDPRITTGDEILSIDGVNVVGASHHKVVQLMGEAATRGQVTMILRRRNNSQIFNANNLPQIQLQSPQVPQYPYDVIVSRHENEGFGFVIISSSNQYYGSTIGKIMPGSPADRCGELKVGDRIIAVNRIDIAGMSHGEVVNLIKESGLHVRLTIGALQTVDPLQSDRISANANLDHVSKLQLQTTQPQQQFSIPQQPILTAAIKKQTEQKLLQQQQQQQQQHQHNSFIPGLSESNGEYIDRMHLNQGHRHL